MPPVKPIDEMYRAITKMCKAITVLANYCTEQLKAEAEAEERKS